MKLPLGVEIMAGTRWLYWNPPAAWPMTAVESGDQWSATSSELWTFWKDHDGTFSMGGMRSSGLTVGGTVIVGKRI